MTRRRLRPDEIELWQQIARSTDPLHKRGRHRSDPPQKQARAEPQAKADPAPVQPFTLGQAAPARHATQPMPQPTGKWLEAQPKRMDSKAYTRLKRGKLAPEARIDLHGLTLDEAHPRLISFILRGQSRGLRLVLVITGKGRREDPYEPMPDRRGVLKRQVPLWLGQAPVAQAVLQIAPAHIRHGGEGAYYVYLKKRR
ncbi:Smr/MutS family protein [Citreimonas sp.]|uniref:Smr/MutS family protein n=1 Tax=Citreimonas sp. TaxID=3036715 RepID=UPI00405A46AD